MTALCGLAQEVTIGSLTIGAFWILLVCRVGVGIGEAGCTPPANSLIADYYPPKKRSTALGYYAMGVTLGTLLANLIGGPVTDEFGWRTAFIVLGMPGIIVAVIFKLTVKEPPRGYSDPSTTVRKERASFGSALGELMSKKSYWTMTVAATIAAFGGYGIANFQSVFLNRSFGLTSGQAAVWVNVPVSLSAAIGTFFIGWLAEKLASRHPNAIAWLPGIGMILCVPFYLVAFTSKSLAVVLICLCVGALVKYGYLAAQYTIGQGVVTMRVRATSTAIMLFVINLIGYGFGPLFIGALSDFLFKLHVADQGLAGELVRKSCEGAAKKALPLAQQDICSVVHPLALQQSMLITACIYAVGGLFFLWTCRWLKKDMVAV
jgi:MFS family permease